MMYKRITSRKNELVKDAASLLSKSVNRSKAELFMAEGARLCSDAARSGIAIRTCFFTEAAQTKYAPYLQSILNVAEEAYLVEEHVAQLLSDTKNHQGIFCVCRIPRRDEAGRILSVSYPAEKQIKMLVLENIQDPSNMGNVLRTAEALGVSRIAMVGSCCDLYSPKVLRGSMGAVFRLAVRTYADVPSCLSSLEQEHITSLASVPDDTACPVTAIPFGTGNWAIWVGNEGNGLSESAKQRCSRRITIPMLGRAESFNASTAAAILLWEMMRSASDKEC